MLAAEDLAGRFEAVPGAARLNARDLELPDPRVPDAPVRVRCPGPFTLHSLGPAASALIAGAGSPRRRPEPDGAIAPRVSSARRAAGSGCRQVAPVKSGRTGHHGVCGRVE